jgi:hypothetical protein
MADVARSRAAATAAVKRPLLEFQHVIPYADDAQPTSGKIKLRSRAHNQYGASLFAEDGGPDHVGEV